MLVKATAQGYHEGFREVGDEFNVPDGAESPWWVKLDDVVEVVKTPAQPTSFSEMNASNANAEAEMVARKTTKR